MDRASMSVKGRRSACRASSNSRVTSPPPAEPPVCWFQISSMVASPCGRSFSLLVAQAASVAAASRTVSALIQIRDMDGSCGVVDLATLRVVIDVERPFDMHGNSRAGLHVDGREGLPVEFVDPLRHLLDTTRQNTSHGLVARDADGAERPVAVADVGHSAVVLLDERRGSGSGGRDASLRPHGLPALPPPPPAHAWPPPPSPYPAP